MIWYNISIHSISTKYCSFLVWEKWILIEKSISTLHLGLRTTHTIITILLILFIFNCLKRGYFFISNYQYYLSKLNAGRILNHRTHHWTWQIQFIWPSVKPVIWIKQTIGSGEITVIVFFFYSYKILFSDSIEISKLW